VQKKRRSIRLKEYDYAQDGWYFVTICTEGHVCLFGDVIDGEVMLNEVGKIAEKCWQAIPTNFPCAGLSLDEFIVMPDHIQGIIIIKESNSERRGVIHHAHDNYVRDRDQSSNQNKPWGLMNNPELTLGKIIRYFKANATKMIHDCGNNQFTWQRNYYERIILNQNVLNNIRQYIINNPLNWEYDRYKFQSENI